MLNKILLPIFIALFLLIIIEGVYVFVQKPTAKPKPIANISPSPTPTARGFSARDFLNSAAVSSFLVNQYEGKILVIDNSGGIAKELNNFQYQTKVVIKGKGQNTTRFYADKKMLDVVKISKIENGIETPITINDLAVGDTIRVKEVWKLNPQTASYSQLVQGEVQKIQ